MRNTMKIATGFVTGTLLGVSLGLLFAPKSGTKTREMIADKAKELKNSVSKAYDKTRERIGINSKHTEDVAA